MAEKTRRSKALIATAMALGLTLAACTDEDEGQQSTGTDTTGEAQTDGGGESDTGEPGDSGGGDEEGSGVPGTHIDTSSVEIPDDRVGETMQWLLDQLAETGAPSEADAAERFADIFLQQLPAEDIAETFDQVRAMGLTEMTSYTELPAGANAYLEGPEADPIEVQLTVDSDGEITGLWFTPPVETTPTESLPDVVDYVEANVENYSVLTASVDGSGQCDIDQWHGQQEMMPTASQFKTWVLAAVVHAVADGDLSWDEDLELTEELRSLPSGTLQEEDAGHVVSVQEAALRMMRDSDNTATDMLMDAVGQERLVTAVEESGHHDPAALDPMLTTRQLFQIAMTGASDEWQAAGGDLSDDFADTVEDRRAFLEDMPEWDLEISPNFGSITYWQDGIDWFATAEDLCNSYATLWDLAETDAGEPVAEIMSANTGLDTDQIDDAAYLGFKGGSSVGNISGGWMVEREDGSRDVVVIMTATSDPLGTLPGVQLAELGQGAINDS